MPVNEKDPSNSLSSRVLYEKSALTRLYWDYKDKAVLKLFTQTGNSYILDVGCGEGIFLERLVRYCTNGTVIGIDFLDENIEICLSRGLPARRGDVYHLDFPDNSIDTITLIEVIEHLLEPEKAISELERILRPSGRLFIVFPNDKFFKISRYLTFKFREANMDYGHVCQWTHRKIRNVLEKNNFTILKNFSIPFVIWPLSLHGIVLAEKR